MSYVFWEWYWEQIWGLEFLKTEVTIKHVANMDNERIILLKCFLSPFYHILVDPLTSYGLYWWKGIESSSCNVRSDIVPSLRLIVMIVGQRISLWNYNTLTICGVEFVVGLYLMNNDVYSTFTSFFNVYIACFHTVLYWLGISLV